MKLNRTDRPYGYYAGLWIWLDTIGVEGVDYTCDSEPAAPMGDTWVISEIKFKDPKHETFAQLRWA